MENKIKPFSEWPWWVKFMVIPSGSVFWKSSVNIYGPLLLWIGGSILFFSVELDTGLDDKFTLTFFLFNLGMYAAFQSYAAHWISINSSPSEIKDSSLVNKSLYGLLLVVLLIGLPLLHALAKRHNLL